MTKREEANTTRPFPWLKCVAVLHFIFTAQLVYAIVDAGPARTSQLVTMAVLAVFSAGTGWGLWKRHAWSRRAAICLYVLLLMLPAGILFYVLFLWSGPAGIGRGALGVAAIAWLAAVGPVVVFLIWLFCRPQGRALFSAGMSRDDQ
jgi:hypothetical protein